jgi:hypothetical protein
MDRTAMCTLLQHLGVSRPLELQYLNDSQMRCVVELLKLFAAKVFRHLMGTLPMTVQSWVKVYGEMPELMAASIRVKYAKCTNIQSLLHH